MPATPELIWIVAALILGFILGLLPAIILVKSRIEAARLAGRQELSSDLATLDERLCSRNARLERLEIELREKDEKLDSEQIQKAKGWVEDGLKALRKRLQFSKEEQHKDDIHDQRGSNLPL